MTTSKEAEFDYSEARKAFEKDDGYGGDLDLDWDVSCDGYLLGETQHIYQIYRDGYKAGALSKEPSPSQLPEEVAKLVDRLNTQTGYDGILELIEESAAWLYSYHQALIDTRKERDALQRQLEEAPK